MTRSVNITDKDRKTHAEDRSGQMAHDSTFGFASQLLRLLLITCPAGSTYPGLCQVFLTCRPFQYSNSNPNSKAKIEQSGFRI